MRKASTTIALIGTPFSGKTTLFNRLTKNEKVIRVPTSAQHSIKEAPLRKYTEEKNGKIINLPEIYSLSAKGKAEDTVRHVLKAKSIDVILNIVDADHLERDLFLTLTLLSVGIPMVIAFNMTEKVKKGNNISFLEKTLGVPIIPISATQSKGLRELTHKCLLSHDIPIPISFSDRKEADEIIHQIIGNVQKGSTRKNFFLDRLDSVICRPMIGIPLFLTIMSLVFFFTFSSIGGYLSVSLERLFQNASAHLQILLCQFGISKWLQAWITDGVWMGVSSVLSYIPQTAIFFFLLGVLKESGYLIRAALVIDDCLRRFGISGKATLPLLTGFGCTASAVTATEEQEDTEKESTLVSLPFIPCSARLPIILLVTTEFFETNSAVLATFLYIVCLLATLFSITLFHRKSHGEAPPLILELPEYQLPCLTNLFREIQSKLKDFLIRAGTYVFLSCAIVNLLAMLTPDLRPTMNTNESILVMTGERAAPLFSILGFGDGRLIAALASGFFAKEAIVSTIHILIPSGLHSVMPKASAISFSVFSLLYVPCAATLSAIHRELGRKKALLLLIRTFTIAFLFSYLTYTILRLL